MTFAQIFPYAMISALLSMLLCLRARSIGHALGLMDVPSGRKKHAHETPLMGGIVLLCALLPVAVAAIYLMASDRWLPSFSIWLGAVSSMALIGIADDRHSLSPRMRLALSFLVFGAAAAYDPTFNVRVLDFEHPAFAFGLGSWWFAIVFTVICLVGLVNAINMADGKNGLVIGLCIGWLVLLSVRAPQPMIPLIMILCVALAVLLVFNMAGRLFLGDGGAYGAAAAIGMLAIMIYNSPGDHALRAISAEELVVLFIVPVADSFRLTYTRMRQGRSPMDADRDHLHHHMQDRFGWPQGLFMYWTIALGPAAMWFAIL
jgi:UDP-GlcNAc:undecaprenyl-phosphate/decaprenyl-phosphate GlcNAc-1-phosphate transferase